MSDFISDLIFGKRTSSLRTEIDQTRKTTTVEQRQACEETYQKALDGNGDVNQAKFDFAWCLVHQEDREDVRLGSHLFAELISVESFEREALYYHALSQYLLAHYEEARASVTRLLSIDPRNRQGLTLKRLIEEGVSKDGMLGMAVVGGALATAVVVGSMILKK